jgi:hypothetical protein
VQSADAGIDARSIEIMGSIETRSALDDAVCSFSFQPQPIWPPVFADPVNARRHASEGQDFGADNERCKIEQ